MTHPVLDQSWTIPNQGDTIAGKYVIEAERGRGGLAVVFSAIQSELDRRVAIKMLLPEWAGDAEVVERFVREGRAATRIKSEHVVHVFDVGTLPNGAPYLVLEYLEGHNLDEVVRSWGPLPVPTAIDWLLQASEAIAEAHVRGIVHRDLKPANLFLTQHADGTACIKVIDFGLSKITTLRLAAPMDALTRTTDVLGSPHYMAPEQLRSTHPVDARTDLWALGVVLYELLTGKLPFAGATLPELFAAVLTQPVPPVSAVRGNVPPAVEQAIYRCLQKEPEARFESITELARALAPYGTRLSRGSFERIERTVRDNGRLSDWSLLPPLGDNIEDDPWPAVDDRQAFRTPTSARVVVGSFFMLSGLFIGAFMWIYQDVHAGEHRRAGVTSMQPTRSATTPTPRPEIPTLAPAAIPTPAPAPPIASPEPAPVGAFPPVPQMAPAQAVPALAPRTRELAAPFATVGEPTETPPLPARADERRNDHAPGRSPASRPGHSHASPRPNRNGTHPPALPHPWASGTVTDDSPAEDRAAGDPRGVDAPAGESAAGRPRVDESPQENDPYAVPDGPSTPPAPSAPAALPPPPAGPAAPDSIPQSSHSADTLFDGRK